jgi:peptidyl-tRNA hydrolase, PTH2 family
MKSMGSEPEFKWKQCLVVRNDLGMSCGKKCAQAAHAALSAYERAGLQERKSWFSEGQKKVVLKSPDERTLYELRSIAESLGVAFAIIQDAGMTEIPPGTVTALGLGPARTELLDRITGSLSLL